MDSTWLPFRVGGSYGGEDLIIVALLDCPVCDSSRRQALLKLT
jgi:hypothetical protein